MNSKELMPEVPLSENESERLAALIALGIVGTERTAEFDIFPALARNLFSTPVAAISLVEKDRQWFKASVGLDVTETSRDSSFCAHAILKPGETLCVSDATKDPRFSGNPLVVGDFGLRFYAGAPIFGPSGHPLGALCVIDREPREVSDSMLDQLRQLAIGVSSALKLHASVQELRDLAVSDQLTGLTNRAGFDRRLRDAFALRNGMPPLSVGLLFLDLDSFKAINDSFGHGGGDAALQEVAQRLRRVSREGTTISRFGGDEFCILVEDLKSVAGLHSLSARIHAALAQPFTIEQQCIPLRTSIGVACCSTDTGDPEALVRQADAALYEAKRAGRGTTQFATPVMVHDRSAPVGRHKIREMLHSALLPQGREPFALALQPIFHATSRHLAGFEALVRWPDVDGGVMMPSDFIPEAEATGLVVHLDRWVLDQACRLAAGWPAHLQISSNLSAANFLAGDLVGDVRATVERHGLAPDRLKLEITETVMFSHSDLVKTALTALQELGAHTILDDFGVGHASIANLRNYPFNGLKIDRSFISGIETDPRSLAFVRAIIDMARALGIKVTAEGVETEGQLRLLCGEGLSTIQGYLLGPPMTPSAASTLIGTIGSYAGVG